MIVIKHEHFFRQFADVYCKEKKTVINDKIRLYHHKCEYTYTTTPS